jgi:hypothetical protein
MVKKRQKDAQTAVAVKSTTERLGQFVKDANLIRCPVCLKKLKIEEMEDDLEIILRVGTELTPITLAHGGCTMPTVSVKEDSKDGSYRAFQ